MEKGWSARGLLQPLWARVGGRDALAELTGITGQTLSAYNTGKRPLGHANARRIAEALEVSVLELGAPAEEADESGRTILGRLEALEERDVRAAEAILKLRKDLAAAVRSIRVLERQSPAKSRPAAKEKGSKQ